MACLGPNSDLARAGQAVAFVNHGKRLQRPRLVSDAKMFYQRLHGSLAKTIENPGSGNIKDAKMMAVLLGLFESTCVFSIRALGDSGESLDDLQSSLDMLWKRSEAPLESTKVGPLRGEAIVLEQRFAKWENSRATEFKPTAIAHVSQI
ncbi:Uu.00g125400.m01.CDS01 [Anthostomella pinea]|uniref:Uu.00g125400.m01.CDS01 n=1 Tax=Anthostomella pinea TaxID=933095 RepID=A0AAI8YHQ0_9PEZI|nr:Uu.00g125400.m01.CDS01 [Anthostomella pinea]